MMGDADISIKSLILPSAIPRAESISGENTDTSVLCTERLQGVSPYWLRRVKPNRNYNLN